jgi:O-antigen/teichoic acid export membrane protein
MRVLGILCIPIFTRLLTPAEYGTVAIFLSTVTILVGLSGLATNVAIKRFYFDKDVNFGAICGTVIRSLIPYHACILVLGLFFRAPLSRALQMPSHVIFAALLSAIALSYMRIRQDYLQVRHRSTEYVIYQFLQAGGGILLGLAAVVVLDSYKMEGRIFSFAIASILSGVVAAVFLFRQFTDDYDLSLLSKSLALCLPLVPSILSSHVLAYIDRLIIGSVRGVADAGVYSLGYQVGMVLNMVILASSRSWQPYFYQCLSRRTLEELTPILRGYSAVIHGIAACLILFGREIVVLLSGEAYVGAAGVVSLVAVGYVFFFYYTLWGHYTVYYRKTGYNSAIIIFVALVNVLLNVILVPRYGIMAAAWTTTTSYILQFVMFWGFVHIHLSVAPKMPASAFLASSWMIAVAGMLAMIAGDFFDPDAKSYLLLRLLALGGIGAIALRSVVRSRADVQTDNSIKELEQAQVEDKA